MEEFNVKIIPISKEHYGRIAELHSQGYAGDFLPSFGPRFLVALYDAMFRAKAAIGFVGMVDEEIAGFCIFTPDVDNLFPATLKKGFFKLGWLAALKTLQNPSILKKILQTFLYKSRAKLDDIKAEMILWAVDPKYHGHGLGTELFNVCEKEMVNVGLDCYKFTTIVDEEAERTKKAAHAFFEKRGYEWISEFEFYGRKWHLYRARLTEERWSRRSTGTRQDQGTARRSPPPT